MNGPSGEPKTKGDRCTSAYKLESCSPKAAGRDPIEGGSDAKAQLGEKDDLLMDNRIKTPGGAHVLRPVASVAS